MRRLLLTATACAAFVTPAFLVGPSLDAQAPASAAFEVASVRPNKVDVIHSADQLVPSQTSNA